MNLGDIESFKDKDKEEGDGVIDALSYNIKTTAEELEEARLLIRVCLDETNRTI